MKQTIGMGFRPFHQTYNSCLEVPAINKRNIPYIYISLLVYAFFFSYSHFHLKEQRRVRRAVRTVSDESFSECRLTLVLRDTRDLKVKTIPENVRSESTEKPLSRAFLLPRARARSLGLPIRDISLSREMTIRVRPNAPPCVRGRRIHFSPSPKKRRFSAGV